MDIKIASRFYNATGVSPRTDPACAESHFVIDRCRTQLSRFIKPGMKVIDLGCNAGRFVFFAEELGAMPVGIDCAQVPLTHAQALAERKYSCASFIKGDYRALPFGPASFDVVLLINNIIECSYEDMDRILQQLQSILVPGGLFCLSMGDHFQQYQQGKRDLKVFDPSTGMMEYIAYTTEDGEEIPHRGYFWTSFFARFLCSRYLTLVNEEVLENGSKWFVFENGPV